MSNGEREMYIDYSIAGRKSGESIADVWKQPTSAEWLVAGFSFFCQPETLRRSSVY
jgi:hypothetical protein